jgi:hypothetical protein
MGAPGLWRRWKRILLVPLCAGLFSPYNAYVRASPLHAAAKCANGGYAHRAQITKAFQGGAGVVCKRMPACRPRAPLVACSVWSVVCRR